MGEARDTILTFTPPTYDKQAVEADSQYKSSKKRLDNVEANRISFEDDVEQKKI